MHSMESKEVAVMSPWGASHNYTVIKSNTVFFGVHENLIVNPPQCVELCTYTILETA